MTVHSGIFGPVHTGIVSGIELFGAIRLQRRLHLAPPLRLRGRAGVFHRRAAPPHRPSLGRPLLPRFVLLSSLRRSCPRRGFDRRLGLFQASPSSWTSWSTLPRRARLLGLSGGRWAANDGKVETAVHQVEVLVVYWHFHGSMVRDLNYFQIGGDILRKKKVASTQAVQARDSGDSVSLSFLALGSSSECRMVGTPEKRGLLPPLTHSAQ